MHYAVISFIIECAIDRIDCLYCSPVPTVVNKFRFFLSALRSIFFFFYFYCSSVERLCVFVRIVIRFQCFFFLSLCLSQSDLSFSLHHTLNLSESLSHSVSVSLLLLFVHSERLFFVVVVFTLEIHYSLGA